MEVKARLRFAVDLGYFAKCKMCCVNCFENMDLCLKNAIDIITGRFHGLREASLHFWTMVASSSPGRKKSSIELSKCEYCGRNTIGQ